MFELTIAKAVLTKNIGRGLCGIFSDRNTVGDPMITLYKSNKLQIDVANIITCYFEVFGLSDADYRKLVRYYYNILAAYEEATGVSAIYDVRDFTSADKLFIRVWKPIFKCNISIWKMRMATAR